MASDPRWDDDGFPSRGNIEEKAAKAVLIGQ
jgi:hypothetical protein